MLEAMGLGSIDDLFAPIPEALRFRGELTIPTRLDQMTLARHAARLAQKNAHADERPCFLGAGIYDHYVPPTVAAITGRSEFYTSYTPYQPEVSQGVLQSIFEFQTLLCELLAMDVANASMYDGATALAEACLMAADLTGRTSPGRAGDGASDPPAGIGDLRSAFGADGRHDPSKERRG